MKYKFQIRIRLSTPCHSTFRRFARLELRRVINSNGGDIKTNTEKGSEGGEFIGPIIEMVITRCGGQKHCEESRTAENSSDSLISSN